MTLLSGERQVAPTVDGIRRDHTARYEFAASQLPRASRVIDFACGAGYGARILGDAGLTVFGYDIDAEAIDYARRHYSTWGAEFIVRDAASPGELPPVNAAVCFETIEHVKDPRPLLRALRKSASVLFASVPNEYVFPYIGQLYHFRHYTPGQFQTLLAECGWAVQEWFCQKDDESEVEPGVDGRTVLVRAIPCEEKVEPPSVQYAKPAPPGHVAILGLGPSVRQFLELTKRLGGRRAFCDEVWGINAVGDVFACDRIFHQDDVRIQSIRAAAKPDSNIAQMLKWLKTTKIPVVTSRAHPDYPALEEFPLAEVVTEFPLAYFNSTAAYAVAYALHIGATKISCWGFDYTYPDVHDAEKGRACVEFWLGIAAERGVEIALPKTTSLMDAMYPQAERFYGYDTLDLAFTRDESGVTVTRTERATLPTAEEIEAAYCHKSYGDNQREAVERAN